MDLFAGIESRTSALKLSAPGPSREHIEQMIHAATRAPDHGRLRPWRFVVLEGAAIQKLGDEMARMLQAKMPQATPEQLNAERAKPMRAPTIIAVAAKITKGKIPDVEQVAAVSAGVQNMLLAAHALGYGAMWKTGAAAYDANVKASLGLSPDDHQIVAFLYLGTIVTPGSQVSARDEGMTTWL
ncbi:MAG: nitroreductase family protein [Steroidobacter sp.]